VVVPLREHLERTDLRLGSVVGDQPARNCLRVQSYEGHVEEITLRPPDRGAGCELAGAFLLSKRESTRSAYRRDLADFATFLAAAGVVPLSVGRVHVDAYARMLERHGAAPTSIARRLACLAGLSAYALAEELVDRNPVAHVDCPHVGADSQTLGPDRVEASGSQERPSATPHALLERPSLLTAGFRIR